MPKELRNPAHVAKLPKYGHDLSKILKFSSNPGQLLPVFYDLAQAGDKYRFNTEMFTQVTDLVSPAMIHMEEHVEWYFVPLRQLYQFADDNLYSLDNSRTSYRRNISDSTVMPMIDEINLLQNNSLRESVDGAFDISDLDQDVDMFGVPRLFNSIRLFHHLGYGNITMKPDSEFSNKGYDIKFFLAYQKIFYDCYRLTDRLPNKVDSYNVDDLSGLVQQISIDRVKAITELHYRPWRKDFFTSSFVSPLIDVDAVGMQQASQGYENSLEKFNNWLINSAAELSDSEGGEATNGYPTTVQQKSSDNTPFSLALLRGMFAVEKLSEITRRAAKRYDAQVLAHFGFKVPEGIGTEVIRCGSDKSILKINEIVATSSGSATAPVTGDVVNTTFGERSGRGNGYNQNPNKSFVAPCDGILMAIYSAEPLADYDDSMIDRFNTFSTRADYFKPEYDRLGMAPLFWYQLNGDSLNDDSLLMTEVLGWQYRYMEYKMKFNQCLGAFVHTEYKNWTIFRSRDEYSTDRSLSTRFFYINPKILDNILLVHTEYPEDQQIFGYQTVYGRDCLLHWFKFNVFKSSVISNYSLPSL